jgi:hypothetical protein
MVVVVVMVMVTVMVMVMMMVIVTAEVGAYGHDDCCSSQVRRQLKWNLREG